MLSLSRGGSQVAAYVVGKERKEKVWVVKVVRAAGPVEKTQLEVLAEFEKVLSKGGGPRSV